MKPSAYRRTKRLLSMGTASIVLLFITFWHIAALHPPRPKYIRATLISSPNRHGFFNSMSNPMIPAQFSTAENTPSPYLHCLQVVGSHAKSHQVFPFNARTMCMLRTVCITPRSNSTPHSILHLEPYVTEDNATCTSVTTDFSPIGSTENPETCATLWHMTRCAHGHHVRTNDNTSIECPRTQSLYDASQQAHWLSGLTIIFPPYKYFSNIYHFSQAFLPAMHMTASLEKIFQTWRHSSPPQQLNLVFRSGFPQNYGVWQEALAKALINTRLRHLGYDVSINTTHEDDHFNAELGLYDPLSIREGLPFCTHSAVLLGPLPSDTEWAFMGGRAVDEWPFIKENGSVAYSSNGTVPVEAIVMRKAVYKFASIDTIISDELLSIRDGSDAPSETLLDLPPRRLVYSRRNKQRDPKPGGFIQKGTTRRFSDPDEEWFIGMLYYNAQKLNFSVGVAETPEGTRFGTQVKMYRKGGVIVGIHGANLMNAMFAPAFSVLVEIAAHQLRCYIRGGNAGLGYISYKPVKDASVEESFCPPASDRWGAGLLCHSRKNFRRVMIDDARDRKALAAVLIHAMEYVNKLHAKFGHLGGVPVRLDSGSTEYVIDWAAGK